MALIGFIVILALGILLVFCGVLGALVSLGFGGHVEDWRYVIILCGAGSTLIYFAVKYCPIIISLNV